MASATLEILKMSSGSGSFNPFFDTRYNHLDACPFEETSLKAWPREVGFRHVFCKSITSICGIY